MLEGREAIEDRRDVGLHFAGALDRQQHLLFTAGLRKPHPLIAPRLLIDLDHPRAVRLHAPNLTPGIVLIVDLGELRGALSAIEHVAGRIDARPQHDPRLHHLAPARRRRATALTDRRRWSRRMRGSRRTPTSVSGKFSKRGVVQVRVCVDEAGDHGCPAASMRRASAGIWT